MDIRQLRRTSQVTQLELAQRTGISRVRISFAECGYISLSTQELALVRQALLDAVDARAGRLLLSVAAIDHDVAVATREESVQV